MAKFDGIKVTSIVVEGNATIANNTSDGDDSGSLALYGAGSDGTNRGSRIVVTGNENPSPGLIQLLCGDVASGEIQILTSGAQNVRIQTSATNRIRWENDAHKWTYFGQPTFIGASTSDGSDNMSVVLNGGGGTTATGTRGGFVQVYGNEASGGTGGVRIVAGNASGSAVSIETFGPRTINFLTDSISRGQVTAHGTWHMNSDQGTTNGALITNAENESFIGDVIRSACFRAASSAYTFFKAQSDINGTPDNEFILRGDGNGLCDGSFTGGGADYAEYFETAHSGVIPVGRTVVHSGLGLIREAQIGEESQVVGVIRPKVAATSLVGNLPLNWPSKYEKDTYGAYVLDQEGNRALNPAFDPELTYATREERDEWVVVGLLGQVAVDKTAPKNPNWLYLKDLSQDVELWLIK